MIGIGAGIPPPADLQDKVVDFRMNLAQFLTKISLEEYQIEENRPDSDANDIDELVQPINMVQSYGSYRTDLPRSQPLVVRQPLAPEESNLLLPLTPAVFSSDLSSSSPRKDQSQSGHVDSKHEDKKRKWELDPEGDILSAETPRHSKRLKSSLKSAANKAKTHRKTRSTASRVQFRSETEQASFLNPSQVGSSDSPSTQLLIPNTPPRPPGKPKTSSKAAIVTRSSKKEV